MRKIIISVVTCFLFSFLSMNVVLASSKIEASLITKTEELSEGDQVEVVLRFDKYTEIQKGVNAYKATLEYDKQIFEEVVESNFSCQNSWESLKYNPANGQFVAIRKARSNKAGEVVKITLKVKKGVKATKTVVKVKDITTSEGKKDLFLKDSSLILHIIEEQQQVPTTPNKPSHPNNNGNTTTIPNKPNASGNVTGSVIGGTTKPETDTSDKEDSKDPVKPEVPDDSSDSNIQKPTNPDVSDKDLPTIKKTTRTYLRLFLFVLAQIILAIGVILYCKRGSKEKQNHKEYLMFLVAGILFSEFIGITCAFARSLTQKGELNGDFEVNYADVSLLQLHLIDLKKLPDDKLENADMNNDGKITVSDLSFLVQKLENLLEYDVDIVHLNLDNYYPQKNDTISVTFNGDVSYGETIEKLMINGNTYTIERQANGEYHFDLNVEDKAGVKTYKITEVLLTNEKKVVMDYTIQVDVLKDVPSIRNYRVEEDKKNAKVAILFDVIDPDSSLKAATIEIYNDDQTLKTKQNLKRGENRIEIEVEDAKEYKAHILLDYDLDSNQLENDENHTGTQKYEKELQLILSYNFDVSDIKTQKDGKETTTFANGEEVQLVFESKNDTKYVPAFIKVNGKEYEVVEDNGKYSATLDALTNLGSHTITVESIILSNGKEFVLTDDNVVTIQVIKRKPTVSNLTIAEFTEANNLRVMFDLSDPDKALTGLSIILLDADGDEIDRKEFTQDQLNNVNNINTFLKSRLTSKYKVKVLVSYNLTGDVSDQVVDEVAKEEEIAADARVEIKSITPNSSYVKKGDLLKLTFDLESNKTEDITRILINNVDCIAVKLDNGNYEVALHVGNQSGIYPLSITKLTYSDGTTATIDSTINVDILKDKPQVTNFAQQDNLLTREVNLSFDIEDDENSFISGKAVLTLDGNHVEKEIHSGHNELTFQVESAKKYTLEIKATYDLDANALNGKPEEDNRVIDEVIATREISLIADYQLTIANIKTYNQKEETKYFGKSEPIKVSFESTNVTNFEPIKAVVNGVEYDLTKIDNAYYLTINSHRTSGVKTARIEKITLSNAKEFTLSENNEIKVTVLKDRPTVEEFGYKENMDATVSATFKVIDEEEAITAGKALILKNGITVKEQALEKGQNTVTFQPEENQNYVVKVIADYDLDMNVLEEDANEYKNMTLLEADITLGARKFEMKDIIRVSVYKQTADGVVEVSSLRESDLANLDNYIAKVYLKQMPTFYTKITGYRIENKQLKLTLAYDNVVQYTSDSKQDKLEIVYGSMENGVAENITLESLIREMEANPTGTFTLTRDYDASIITKNSNALISTSFMGTLNGNGHKIYNLTKPLFDTIESATIENLVLESPKLTGANSRGTIANIATNATIRNIHVKDLTLITGANQVGGVVGEATSTTIEQSSVTNFSITTSGHIRVAAIIGKMDGGVIRNCYVEGTTQSTQNKDGNGIGGILGHGLGTSPVTIENCISKVHYTSNVSPRLNGDIAGVLSVRDSVLRNNVSLSTGENFYSIHGNEPNADATNNYELLDSGLRSNASGNRVKQVERKDITKDFFINSANFDETIWDLSDVSYENPPQLKVTIQSGEATEEEEKPTNKKLYIPDYTRIKRINGYTETKDILYHNINKLMPYYDAKYLVEDGLKITNDHVLNTKIIKHILPYSHGKMVTYLTSKNKQDITSIKVVFEDATVSEYNVAFKEVKQDIAIYTIEGMDLEYAFHNYVIKDTASIVETLKNYISSVDYTATLDPITAAADSRLYRDHYNEVMKPLAERIALQLLQNDANSVLTMNNEILNNKIKQELIDSGRLNNILYAYNYYHRWYQFEIGGSKVSDILLFEGKMYKDSMTIDNLTEEVLTGNLGTNATHTFFANSLSKYTGSSALTYYLDGVIRNIGGYDDINDWFTEHFSSIGILAEVPVENHPEVMYRAWARMKGFPNFILPLSTLPKYAGYIISGPAQFQVGAQRVYVKDPETASGQNTVRNLVNNHVALIKRQFDTMAGSFHVESWNNFTIMVYDTVKTITGYKTSYFPGTNIPIGTSPVTTWNKSGTTTEPFSKNFNEAVGAWQYGSAAGVGNTAGFLWFIARPGLTNYETWTHEFEHALYDKIMLFRKGARLQLETYTEGNVQQTETWSNNNISGYDVGPYYFNFAFTLGKESMATQNLTPERINTREKLENYFKGQFDALELLDYASAKAFIQLTPEEQAKIATRMNQSAGWSTWGTITAEQAEAMNLTTLESLWDNRIMLRPNNAWGVSVRGLVPINSIGANDYGYESIWVTRWYMGHYDNGYADAFSNKKNMFEMLGYGGVDGYVTFGSKLSSTDLDAIQKITLAKTGTAMNWKEYRMSRYAEIESKKDNKYVNIDLMIEQFVEALRSDAKNGNRNITGGTNLRKIYYHYLKRVTNDFIDDPLGTNLEMTHIKTAEELVSKINKEPYGYYILDNDIDFSGMTTNVTQTFMGKLDGNGHKIIGNKIPIFQKIRYGYVKDLILERTDIPMTVSNVGALAVRTEYSVLENVKAKELQLNFGGRNDVSLLGGTVGTTLSSGIEVETLKNKIINITDFEKLNENPGGIYVLESDLDFTGYTGEGSVVTQTFTGKLDGNGHTLSNLTDLSLFANFRGTVENLNIQNFTNTGTGRGNGDFVTAFTQESYTATFRNMKFENITLSGRNNVAVVTGMDGRENANSIFENISVKNANVTGTGVYVSTFIGRKYGGKLKNIYVQGNLEITSTENGGIIGASHQAIQIENVVSNVNVNRPTSTDNRNQNGGFIGNLYNNPSIKDSISIGNMTGFINNDAEVNVSKFTGATAAMITSSLVNCYESVATTGVSNVTADTNGKLIHATSENLHDKNFYKDTLHFDESIWNLDHVQEKGYPELR